MAFIDFGIVGRFSPDTWTGVSRLADGVAQEDFKVMAEVRLMKSHVLPGQAEWVYHTVRILVVSLHIDSLFEKGHNAV